MYVSTDLQVETGRHHFINRTFQFGKVPVRIGVEFHYNVVRPDSVGADWDFRFFIIPAVPSAMFKWMQ